jgi:transposase InsO family protein
VSRQAYYKQQKTAECKAVRDAVIIEMVQGMRTRHKVMGGKKLFSCLHRDIAQLGGAIGRDKFFDVLRRSDLLVKRRRRYARTTDSRHRFRVHKNLVQEFTPVSADQVWVSDITYVRLVNDRFAYLFLITDAYSRKIVGWKLSDSLGLEGALKALQMSLGQCRSSQQLIHHSDRGFQYCSHQYVGKLQSKGIRISMAEAGNCYENAMAERVNGILKMEYGLDETFSSVAKARQSAREGITNYNEERPHLSLKMRTPAAVHNAS